MRRSVSDSEGDFLSEASTSSPKEGSSESSEVCGSSSIHLSAPLLVRLPGPHPHSPSTGGCEAAEKESLPHRRRSRSSMHKAALGVLALCAVVLLGLNLVGVYNLILLLAKGRHHTPSQHTTSTHSSSSTTSSSTSSSSLPSPTLRSSPTLDTTSTSSTGTSTPRQRLKFRFDKTTGVWEKTIVTEELRIVTVNQNSAQEESECYRDAEHRHRPHHRAHVVMNQPLKTVTEETTSSSRGSTTSTGSSSTRSVSLNCADESFDPTNGHRALCLFSSTKEGVPFIARIKKAFRAGSEREVTVVSALLDIGRGNWWAYRRPLHKYHEFMRNVLSLRVPEVLFVDEASLHFVSDFRRRLGLEHKTKVFAVKLSDLPLHRYLSHMEKVMRDEEKSIKWGLEWDANMRMHPEAQSAAYDLVVNSKTHFLYNASVENPFGSEFFVWLDAGYGHGNSSFFPPLFQWNPKFPRGQITLIKVTPPHDKISRYSVADLYRKDWSVVSGGFLAGDSSAILRLDRLSYRKVLELVAEGVVDDDQTTLVLVANDAPSLFRIVHGDWFDAFRLFPSSSS